MLCSRVEKQRVTIVDRIFTKAMGNAYDSVSMSAGVFVLVRVLLSICIGLVSICVDVDQSHFQANLLAFSPIYNVPLVSPHFPHFGLHEANQIQTSSGLPSPECGNNGRSGILSTQIGFCAFG